MGRPPGVKNGTGSHAGTKNSSKPAAGSGGGKNVSKSSSPVAGGTSGGPGEKDKTTVDRSQSNFPYDIRINSYASLHNAVTKGTPRVKRILTEECDYIMECRVCRNLFRSLPNFITHKLNYCKKSFDSTWCIGLSNLIQTGDSPAAPSFSVEYEVDPELVLINAPSNLSSSTEADNPSTELTVPLNTRTRSVADFYNELAERTKPQMEKLQNQPTEAPVVPPSKATNTSDNSNVIRLQLKPLPGTTKDTCNVVSAGGMKSVIVQQQIVTNDPSSCDNLCTKPEVLRKDTAILGPDGKVVCVAPGKGIEQVVSRLTAQLKALEEKEAQKMAAMAKNTIICDVCKTVFDSDKAIRQHKRESLDCGKTWGFKSPHHEKSATVKTSETQISNKREKLPIDGETTTSSSESSTDKETQRVPSAPNPADTSQSVRLSRFCSPPKGRRPSHHHSLNGVQANKTKRNLSLSPVKRIKMKYSKLDSALSNASRDSEKKPICTSYSCNHCSSSFTTKHEMSMHLALCTGVINYAYLKESEPKEEKIRISLRNDFTKTPATTTIPTPEASPAFNSIISESHNLPIRQRNLSGASFSRGDTPTTEVNNNKQYKNNYPLSGTSASSSSEEEDALAVVPAMTLSRRVAEEEEGDSDFTSHDSGVSSASSTTKKTKLLSSSAGGGPKKAKIFKTSSSASSTKNSTNSEESSLPAAKTKVVSGGGGMMSERLEAKRNIKQARITTTIVTARVKQQKQHSSTAINLRKTVQSRIRKSRRVLKTPAHQKSTLKQQNSSSN